MQCSPIPRDGAVDADRSADHNNGSTGVGRTSPAGVFITSMPEECAWSGGCELGPSDRTTEGGGTLYGPERICEECVARRTV